MKLYRITAAVLLALAVGLPVILPFGEALSRPDVWSAGFEATRIRLLAYNTFWLVTGTLLLTLPVGTAAAILLYRTDLPLARGWRFLMLLTLFVPLPLFATAWQATLGTGGWVPLALWTTGPVGEAAGTEPRPLWRPWAQGLGAGIWIHAVAALPWVILLVGQGLRWVERELEEDALTAARPWRVLWHVTLPRCRASLGVAALWVGLVTATEITVADMVQVRTLAEEVYLQFNLHDDAGLARTVIVSLPALLLTGILVVAAMQRWESTLPPLERLEASPRVYSLGKARGPVFALVLLASLVLAAVPLGSLVWRVGLSGSPETWSWRVALSYLGNTVETAGGTLAGSCAVAFAAGGVAALLGLVVCWLAREAPWFRLAVLVLLAAAWVLPAPVLGLGLKEAIRHLLDLEDVLAGRLLGADSRPLGTALYYGPSALPIFWVYVLRFLPFAIALQWPIVRHIPGELRDALRLDGANARQEFVHLVLPFCWPACLRAALAVAVLSLGELGASKLVWAAWDPLAHVVFTQMHYGVNNSLAALCLVLLGLVLLGGLTLAAVRQPRNRRLP